MKILTTLILSCLCLCAEASERLLTWSAEKSPELDIGRKVEREVSWTFRMPLFKTNWGTLTQVDFISWSGFGMRFHVKNNGNTPVNYTNTASFVGQFVDIPEYWQSEFAEFLNPFWSGYQWGTSIPRRSEDFYNTTFGVQDYNVVSSMFLGDFIGQGRHPVNFTGKIYYPQLTVPRVNDLSIFQPMAGIAVYYYFEPVNPARIKYGPFEVFDENGLRLGVDPEDGEVPEE